MKKACNPLIRYFMLVAGILLLLTVIVPHHHHEDGMPCMHISDQDTHDEHSGADAHHHPDCGCSGHTIVFNSNSQQGHSSENHLALLLMPLFTLVDYIYPPQITLTATDIYVDKAVYIESLHDTWIAAATGLRAPPVIIG